jgi:hypothetical protein
MADHWRNKTLRAGLAKERRLQRVSNFSTCDGVGQTPMGALFMTHLANTTTAEDRAIDRAEQNAEAAQESIRELVCIIKRLNLVIVKSYCPDDETP